MDAGEPKKVSIMLFNDDYNLFYALVCIHAFVVALLAFSLFIIVIAIQPNFSFSKYKHHNSEFLVGKVFFAVNSLFFFVYYFLFAGLYSLAALFDFEDSFVEYSAIGTPAIVFSVLYLSQLKRFKIARNPDGSLRPYRPRTKPKFDF